MKKAISFFIAIVMCCSCRMKNEAVCFRAGSGFSKKDEVAQMQENVPVKIAVTKNEIQQKSIQENSLSVKHHADSCSVKSAAIRRLVKSVNVSRGMLKKKSLGNDPPDGHIFLIVFYLFLGAILLSWGVGIFAVSIFAASFIGCFFGVLLIALGAMPVLGVIQMLRGGNKRKPNYKE